MEVPGKNVVQTCSTGRAPLRLWYVVRPAPKLAVSSAPPWNDSF